MPLPALNLHFVQTRTSLQQAAQVLSAVRKATTPPLPNALRLSLYVIPQGLTTGPLSLGGELLLDFPQRAVIFRQPGEPDLSLSLNGHTQRTLTGAVLAALGEEGHDLDIDKSGLTAETPLEIEPQTADDYAVVLDTVFTAVALFRARLFGPQSPVVVWPHGFDLSTLWFAGPGADEHSNPHLNFGFSPASPGFDRPYFYSYAYPLPAGYYDLPLPDGIRAIHEPFKGMVFDYDPLVGLPNAPHLIESRFRAIFHAVSPLMKVE